MWKEMSSEHQVTTFFFYLQPSKLKPLSLFVANFVEGWG
jgi:hypothetical protein